MTWLLLPSGKYINLASLATVEQLDELLTAITLTGNASHHLGKDAAAILEALATMRLNVANRKR